MVTMATQMEDILITVITMMRLFMPGRLSTPRRSTRVKIDIIMTTTLPHHRHLLPHDSIDETTPAVHQRYRHRHLHLFLIDNKGIFLPQLNTNTPLTTIMSRVESLILLDIIGMIQRG